MAEKTKEVTKIKYNVTPNRKGNIIFIPFDLVMTQIDQVTGTSGLIFMPNTSKNVPTASSIIRVIADGTNTPTVTGFTKTSSSNDYDITLNKVNLFSFFFDGTDYWYSVTIS